MIEAVKDQIGPTMIRDQFIAGLRVFVIDANAILCPEVWLAIFQPNDHPNGLLTVPAEL